MATVEQEVELTEDQELDLAREVHESLKAVRKEFVGDSLSDITRKERRNLLMACVAGLVVAKAGLVPSKVMALGIEFSSVNQRAFVDILIAVVIYFTYSFFIYALCDFLTYNDKITVEPPPKRFFREALKSPFKPFRGPRGAHIFATSMAAGARTMFDFLLPVVLAGYVLITLFIYRHGLPK